MKNNLEGISVIIPSYAELKVNCNSVLSVARQWLGKLEEEHPRIEILIYNDHIEDEHYYDYYLSDEFKKLYDTNNVEIKIINHPKMKYYQGYARVTGCLDAKYSYAIFLDDDDMLAPYCVRQYWEIIKQEEKRRTEDRDYENKDKRLAVIDGNLMSFDQNGYRNMIGDGQDALWLQAHCWSCDFVIEHNIHHIYDGHMENSKQAEDFLYHSIFNYEFVHEMDKWYRVTINKTNAPLAYWFPNYNSLSRCFPEYGEHLAPFTMQASYMIYEHNEAYNKEHNIESKEDEAMKMDILNKTIYAWFNLYDYIKTISTSPDWVSNEEEWTILIKAVKNHRTALLKYWNEIQYADIEDQLYRTRHMSDCRCCNVWDGTFYDFMKSGCKWFNLDYNEMLAKAKKLKFDAINCLTSPQVKAYKQRHQTK